MGYAFCFGPVLGLFYDINNRIGSRCDQSAAMNIMGLNLGVGLGPYFYSVLYAESGLGEQSLSFLVLMSVLVPMPLLALVDYYDGEEATRGGKARGGTL